MSEVSEGSSRTLFLKLVRRRAVRNGRCSDCGDCVSSLLLVEQKARQAPKIASRAYLMETGRILASGPAQGLIEDKVLSRRF